MLAALDRKLLRDLVADAGARRSPSPRWSAAGVAMFVDVPAELRLAAAARRPTYYERSPLRRRVRRRSSGAPRGWPRGSREIPGVGAGRRRAWWRTSPSTCPAIAEPADRAADLDARTAAAAAQRPASCAAAAGSSPGRPDEVLVSEAFAERAPAAARATGSPPSSTAVGAALRIVGIALSPGVRLRASGPAS